MRSHPGQYPTAPEPACSSTATDVGKTVRICSGVEWTDTET
jgi:hypothetical protein